MSTFRSRSTAAKLLPALFGAAIVLPFVVAWSVDRDVQRLDWEPYEEAAIKRAAMEDRPVLIEFTADWCLNCKVLERTVYADKGVVSAARESGLVAQQADLTQPDAEIERLLISLGGAGLPYAVVLDREGRLVQRLPDLFGAGKLREAIRRAAR